MNASSLSGDDGTHSYMPAELRIALELPIFYESALAWQVGCQSKVVLSS